MKHLLTLLSTLLLGLSLYGQAADVKELRANLEAATSSADRARLSYELGQALLYSDAEETIGLGKKAYELATDLRNEALAARSAYLIALAYERERRDNYVETWLKSAQNYAKRIGDADLLIKATDKRSKIATKDRNYRRAYQINQEAFSYFAGKGNSISELEMKFEAEKAKIERERRELERQREELADEIEILQEEQTILDQENQQLASTNERKTVQLLQKDEELATVVQEKDSVEQRKAQVEELAQERAQAVKKLSREALEKEAVVAQTKQELAEQELIATQARLEAEQVRSYRNYAIIGFGALSLLAFTLYLRFRSKRKAAKVMADKNKIIEQERKRSDELLLNILPAPIAQELKENGEAQARAFSEATVLFSDFVNFTSISERLGPRDLVRELDTCFKAFDEILEQYPDIEKIKTIGDAYMCATGLTDRKTVPHNLVRVALEMQAFLNEERERRQRLGLPFFEARIGLHTGPVVAGVVGLKKFAYDIWGDTVNTASRVETNCEPGRVNISQTTYNLVKYQFDCLYRGRVQAKNKGEIDMYYVQQEKVGAMARAEL
jgi:adenylate cyclase